MPYYIRKNVLMATGYTALSQMRCSVARVIYLRGAYGCIPGSWPGRKMWSQSSLERRIVVGQDLVLPIFALRFGIYRSRARFGARGNLCPAESYYGDVSADLLTCFCAEFPLESSLTYRSWYEVRQHFHQQDQVLYC